MDKREMISKMLVFQEEDEENVNTLHAVSHQSQQMTIHTLGPGSTAITTLT